LTLLHQTLENYLDQLASSSPTPGGGAVAAVTLAQSAALWAMALRISHKDPNSVLSLPSGDEQSVGTVLHALDTDRREFLCYAEKDQVVFERVMAAYKLPRVSDSEKASRQEKVEQAISDALALCMEQAEYAVRILPSAEYATFCVKPSILSDSAVALELLMAGFAACHWNAKINIKYLRPFSDSNRGTQAAIRMSQLRSTLEQKVELYKEFCQSALNSLK
jgi:formiminotetrahydrofolate cyclodeaminase